MAKRAILAPMPLMRIAAVLLLAFACSAEDRTAELRKVLANQTAAWNRQDLPAFMETYWRSPELTFFSADTITKGWESTLERYQRKYQSNGKDMGQLSFTDEGIEMLGSDAAVVTARWQLIMPDGKKLEGLTTIICKRMRDGWKIVHDHSS